MSLGGVFRSPGMSGPAAAGGLGAGYLQKQDLFIVFLFLVSGSASPFLQISTVRESNGDGLVRVNERIQQEAGGSYLHRQRRVLQQYHVNDAVQLRREKRRVLSDDGCSASAICQSGCSSNKLFDELLDNRARRQKSSDQ